MNPRSADAPTPTSPTIELRPATAGADVADAISAVLRRASSRRPVAYDGRWIERRGTAPIETKDIR